MDVAKRTRLSPEDRRAQLIDLGVTMLSERPLDAISVEEIADHAGVSRGLLFHYFSSKHDFHVAIVEHTSRKMLESTEPPVGLDPITTLSVALASYVDYVVDNRRAYVSLLRGTASGDPDMRSVFERTRDVMVERTASQLPSIDAEDTPRTRLAIRGWVAFCEEVTISWLDRGDLTRTELIELLTGALPALALPSDVLIRSVGDAASVSRASDTVSAPRRSDTVSIPGPSDASAPVT